MDFWEWYRNSWEWKDSALVIMLAAAIIYSYANI